MPQKSNPLFSKYKIQNCAIPAPSTTMYGARNLEMSQIKAEISLSTNVKLNYHKNVGCQ